MSALALTPLSRFASVAPVVIRVLVGIVMAAHGWQKLTQMGPSMLANDMLAGLGVPVPVVVAWLMTLAELVGGILLIVGLFTRLVTIPLLVILVGALILVKSQLGILAPAGSMLPGAEIDLALIAGLVGLLLLGPGKPSLDHALGLETATPALTRDDSHRAGATQPAGR